MADPGFSTWDDANPVGVPILLMMGWGCQPLMWLLFSRNICENERIGSHWGGGGGWHGGWGMEAVCWGLVVWAGGWGGVGQGPPASEMNCMTNG